MNIAYKAENLKPHVGRPYIQSEIPRQKYEQHLWLAAQQNKLFSGIHPELIMNSGIYLSISIVITQT